MNNDPANNRLAIENGLRISLGPSELSKLDRRSYLKTCGASVQIMDDCFKPHAKVVEIGESNTSGIFFAIKLPSSTKTPFPDPGQESLIAYIPQKSIEPSTQGAAKSLEGIMGPMLGGLALIAHGAFNDQESLRLGNL